MFRLSALLATLCIAVSGCGISFVPTSEPASSNASPPRWTAVPTVPPVRPSEAQAPGVVTLTFDDGRISDATAAKMLAQHGLRGTFFINSGTIDMPGYLTLPDLNAIASSGNEIGGHTVTHPQFSTLTNDEIRRQVCEDRNTLLGWGFPVRSFAYPFGYFTPEIEQIVADCGYNSARGLGGLKTIHPPAGGGYSCERCASAETTPPSNPMATKAPAQVRDDWTVDDLKNQVMSSNGGWLQLTFHGICPSDRSDITIAQ